MSPFHASTVSFSAVGPLCALLASLTNGGGVEVKKVPPVLPAQVSGAPGLCLW